MVYEVWDSGHTGRGSAKSLNWDVDCSTSNKPTVLFWLWMSIPSEGTQPNTPNSGNPLETLAQQSEAAKLSKQLLQPNL